MKNLLLAVFLLLGIASCTPVRYLIIDPKDSTKLVEVRKRIIYDDTYLHMPLYFNYGLRTPYYNPIIIQRQRPIVVPQKPQQPNWRRPMPPRAPRNR